MNSYWRKFPPPPVQMMRIAAALGIKPSQAEPAPSETPETTEDQAGSLLQTFPTQAAQPYMSAEEYLRRKAQAQ